MSEIYIKKAEFLLDSIRQGGLNDLMKKSIIKTLFDAGYHPTELEYYLNNGKWLSKDSSPIVEKENLGGVPPFVISRKKPNPFKKLSLLLIFGFLFMFFGMTMILVFSQDSSTKDSSSPAKVIEQTTDDHRAL